MRSPHVRTARAKGLKERTVVLKHALRNALIPVTTILGMQLGALLTGALIVEKVFARAGLGMLLLDGIELFLAAAALPIILPPLLARAPHAPAHS